MIYLIGGAPGSGKTTLATWLAEKISAKVISLDTHMKDWNSLIPKEELAKKLPVWEAKRKGAKPSFGDYRVEAETYWPRIQSLVESFLATPKKTFVVEGAQFSPRLLKVWLDSLDKKSRDLICVLFLYDKRVLLAESIRREAEENGFLVSRRSEARKLFTQLSRSKRTTDNHLKVLYHGSQTPNLRFLKPKPHNAVNRRSVVFATSDIRFALAMISGTGDELAVGYFVHPKTHEEEMYVDELQPGKLKLLQEPGYLYEVSAEGFYQDSKLSHVEFVKDTKAKVLKMIKIKNTIQELKKYKVALVKYADVPEAMKRRQKDPRKPKQVYASNRFKEVE